MIVMRFVDLSLFNLHDCALSVSHYCLKLCSPTVTFGLSIGLHREIVPPRETVAIARVAIAIVGRGG